MNQTTQKTQKTDNDFIMSPKVDVCFAGLMDNPIVRKGFCAAILRVPPETIEKTELLPNNLPREHADDKLGIMDVRVRMMDKTQINMEMQVKGYGFWDERAMFYLCKMFSDQLKAGESYEKLQKSIHVSILDFIHFPKDKRFSRRIGLCDRDTGKLYSDKLEIQVLELKKLPKEIKTGEDIVSWMHFFNGKSKEDFRRMANGSIYLDEAYATLKKLSADEYKRLEYEIREKELRDRNWILNDAKRAGEKRGEKRGRKSGIELAKKVFKLHAHGKAEQDIASECNITVDEVRQILE